MRSHTARHSDSLGGSPPPETVVEPTDSLAVAPAIPGHGVDYEKGKAPAVRRERKRDYAGALDG